MTILTKLKSLWCKYINHDYEPLVYKTGMQKHKCTRCGDEIEAIVIMPGESIELVVKFQEEIKEPK